MGFKPSAPTLFPTVCSHKGGAQCLPTLLWCACSRSVSSSWVLFRVWNYLRRLLANASGALAVLLCLDASILRVRVVLFPVLPKRPPVSRRHYQSPHKATKSIPFTWLALSKSECTRLVFGVAHVWWKTDGPDTWPFPPDSRDPKGSVFADIPSCAWERVFVSVSQRVNVPTYECEKMRWEKQRKKTNTPPVTPDLAEWLKHQRRSDVASTLNQLSAAPAFRSI